MFKKTFQLFPLIFFISLLFISTPPTARADDAPLPLKMQVEIPGYTPDYTSKSTRPIGDYVQAIFKYGIGAVGILATIVMMIGGVLWLTAGGDSGKITEAQAWITAAISGLVLTIGSYLILATVNPDLVNLKVRGIDSVKNATSTLSDITGLGTCLIPGKGCGTTKQENCTGTWLGTNTTDIISQCGIDNINCSTSQDLTACKMPSGNIGFCLARVCSEQKAAYGQACGSNEYSGTCKTANSGLYVLRSLIVIPYLSLAGGPCPADNTWVVGGKSCDGIGLACCK